MWLARNHTWSLYHDQRLTYGHGTITKNHSTSFLPFTILYFIDSDLFCDSPA